jgi:hypothetical protein
MNHQVDESLHSLLTDISTLVPLENNPRKGNLEAIIASYREFGQLKPIVIRPNSDGTSTVIAGNHQLQAAKKLGWTHIAAVSYEVDDARAVAFALADNRTSELGYTDAFSLNEALQITGDDFTDLYEGLGWDIFEKAAISEQAYRIEQAEDSDPGYVPPVIVNPINPQSSNIAVEVNDEGSRIVASSDVDSRKIATGGSTMIGASGIRNAVVQSSLVFDNTEQQQKWYAFVKWLRASSVYDGETITEKLINFIDSHADY